MLIIGGTRQKQPTQLHRIDLHNRFYIYIRNQVITFPVRTVQLMMYCRQMAWRLFHVWHQSKRWKHSCTSLAHMNIMRCLTFLKFILLAKTQKRNKEYMVGQTMKVLTMNKDHIFLWRMIMCRIDTKLLKLLVCFIFNICSIVISL